MTTQPIPIKRPSLYDLAGQALADAPRARLVRHALAGIEPGQALGHHDDISSWMLEWAPKAGPTACLLLVRLNHLVDAGVTDVDLRQVAAAVGVGTKWGKRNHPGFNAFMRLASFRLVRVEGVPWPGNFDQHHPDAVTVYVNTPIIRPSRPTLPKGEAWPT